MLQTRHVLRTLSTPIRLDASSRNFGLQRCTNSASVLNMGVDLCAKPTIKQYHWPL